MPLSQSDARFSYTELLLLPARGTIVLAIIGLGLLYILGYLGNVLGLWLRVITIIAAVRYAQIVVEKLVHGYPEPPPVSPHDFNIYHNFGAMGFYALLIILYLVGGVVAKQFGPPALIAYGVVVVFALPAVLAATVLENSVSSAFDPVRIAKIIRTIGWPYAGVVAIVITGYFATLFVTWFLNVPFVNVFANLYLMFLLSCAVGRLVFVFRHELGLNITSPKERIEQQNAALDLASDSGALQLALQTARLAPKEAAEELWRYHERERTSVPRRFECFQALAKWPDTGTCLHFARPLVRHLLSEELSGDALDVVRWSIKTEPAFRLRDPDTTHTVGLYAISVGQFKLAADVMQDIGTRHPDYPNSISALFKVGNIALEKLGDERLLKGALAQLTDLGISATDERLQTFERGLAGMSASDSQTSQ